ncbi:riboflavin kinase-like [Styela clava]
MNGIKTFSSLPYFCRGTVIKGFGRGSKELGIPTANFPESVVDNLPHDVSAGVYYGWGQIGSGPVHKMVMSIGWNPYYNNTKKSMETHLIHKFDKDFYGSELGLVILGYIRPETNFDSLEKLVKAIRTDIEIANHKLNQEDAREFLLHDFFKHPVGQSSTNGTHSSL